jgi:hypothetical protein
LPPLRATRVLDQLRERLRLMHYSFRTEETYVYWNALTGNELSQSFR